MLSKQQLYEMSDKSVSFEQFSNALDRIQELALELKKFQSKEEAVNHIIKEANITYEKAIEVYDFYSKLANKL